MANLMPIDTGLPNHVVHVSCLQISVNACNISESMMFTWNELIDPPSPELRHDLVISICDVSYPRCGFMTLLKELGILQVPTTVPYCAMLCLRLQVDFQRQRVPKGRQLHDTLAALQLEELSDQIDQIT